MSYILDHHRLKSGTPLFTYTTNLMRFTDALYHPVEKIHYFIPIFAILLIIKTTLNVQDLFSHS